MAYNTIWQNRGVNGIDGVDGTDGAFSMTWLIGQPYLIGDTVWYSTGIWRALTNNTGVTPVEGTDWTFEGYLLNPNRQVYTITDGVDETVTLPSAVGHIDEIVVKRRGSGTGKVLFTTQSAQTIEGLAASIWELEGEGEIVLFPYAGNWEVRHYEDYIVVGTLGATAGWAIHKKADGTMIENGMIRQSTWDGWTVETFGKAFIDTNTRVQTTTRGSNVAYTVTRNVTTTTVEIYQGGSTAVDVSVDAVGRWRV